MNCREAFLIVAENALHADQDLNARLVIYDALAVVAQRAGLFEESADASTTAAALRGAETLELNFRKRLNIGGPRA